MKLETDGIFFRLMPGLFVLLWATGFIGAKYGLPYAGPLSFLAYRFMIVVVILLAVALLFRAPWPDTWRQAGHTMVSGFLIHGVYLGGVFSAISLGMAVGTSALVVGLQPLVTALLSGPLLGERVTPRHWVGILLGLVGVALVLYPRMQGGGELTPLAVIVCVLALLGITFGTIYQKAFLGNMDLRTGGVLQYLGAALPIGIGAWALEGFAVTWSWPFIGALTWLILVLSLGAISLLMLIIRHGDVSKVATLFYLVPPVTAVLAFFLFDEQMTVLQGAGVALTVLAVWMSGRITSRPRAQSAPEIPRLKRT